MKTLRELIEKPIYDNIEYFASLVAKDGEDAVFRGIRVLDDPSRFVHGQLVNATALLYIHYVKSGDSRADVTLERIKKFLSYTCNSPMKTWGKLSVLRAMRHLYKNGMLDKIPNEYLEILKIKTMYDDFLDIETMELKGYPSNYLQVAMACAGIREMLGWDSEPYSEKIRDKLMNIIADGSETGYMDEQPPYSRFDRYSMLVSSEFSDTCDAIEKELPQLIADNLKLCARYCVDMANARGDGVNYGRSLSCHGDGATLEIMSSAFAHGLISECERDTALAYSVKITEKIMSFWFDKELNSFNIWWNGRSTNRYRGEARVLEVNLDMANHMLTTLANFETAGLADTPTDDSAIPCPKGWRATEICFLDKSDKAKAVVLRRSDTMAMLPLIGIGTRYMESSYQPYPTICGVLEAAPEAGYPYLVPEYRYNGKLYRPIQYYSDIKTEQKDGRACVRAHGNLALCGGKNPERTEYTFDVCFLFDGDEISASYVTDLPGGESEMLVGLHGENAECTISGFELCEQMSTEGVYDFFTPHGAITSAKLYKMGNVNKVSYRITLK